MCELFAMSSHQPSALTYSLDQFAKHGGLTHHNRSGWGIAYFDDREAFLVKEPEPAADSPWVRFIASQALKSRCVIAHIRHATVGVPTLRNTHPFRRALAGRIHVFAHNGTIKGLHDSHSRTRLAHKPIGETDSELAFCLLLERLAGLWGDGEVIPDIYSRLDLFSGFAAEMRKSGSSNFLYSDGDALFVHADKRIYEENGGFSAPRPPGLSVRNCITCGEHGPDYACDGLKISLSDQRTMLLASVPLGKTGWQPIAEGTAIAVRNGEELGRRTT